ncbi:C-type mannose receptor 2-like isoform X1, partial [Clarias magur]
ITKQHIIRMKIQSDRDVNNLTVKLAIIKQLKQKLTDHDLTENVTLNWREQTNGVIFLKEKEINIPSADEQCSNIKPFSLYSEFTKKQILKVKIQSNWDVNDRGVKAAILKQ